MHFRLFKREAGPAEPTPEQDAFLQQALSEYHAKLETMNTVWRFPEGAAWDLDRKTGRFRLHFADGSRVEAEAFLIGSYSTRGRRWEWAWGNARLPGNLTAEVGRVKERGDKESFEHLSRGSYPAADPELGVLMAAAAAKIIDLEAVFAGADGGLVLYLGLRGLRRIELTANSP